MKFSFRIPRLLTILALSLAITGGSPVLAQPAAPSKPLPPPPAGLAVATFAAGCF